MQFTKDHVFSEESVVSKISEFMETLDYIKRYNALANSLKNSERNLYFYHLITPSNEHSF